VSRLALRFVAPAAVLLLGASAPAARAKGAGSARGAGAAKSASSAKSGGSAKGAGSTQGAGSARDVAPPPRLLQAYQKEYGFLTAQKRALKKRLDALAREKARKVGAAEAEVNGLQARIVVLRTQAEELTETLRDLKRKGEGQADEDRSTEIIDRARSSLAKLGFEVETVPKDDLAKQRETLKRIFALSARAIHRANQVRVDKGSFFLQSGKKVSGTLVRVGGVATYGLSDRGSGALAPAGQGRLKLWPEDAAATAKALAAGKNPETLRIFLYETLEKNVEPKQEKTFFEQVRAGGKIAWVIVTIGALAIGLILARLVILLIAGLGTNRLLKRVRPLVQRGELEQAQRVAKRSWGSAGRVLQTTLASAEQDREVIEDAVGEAVLKETPRIERFGAAITVFAAVAPLLGLLGTVTGMITTFDVITEHGTGDPKLLAGGISEALITTKLGLMVAIPTLLIGTLLRGWAEAIQVNMERAALHVINLLKGEPLPQSPPPGGGAEAPSEPEPEPETKTKTKTESTPDADDRAPRPDPAPAPTAALVGEVPR
jgi:biopolymer transport protein ExbB